MDDTDDQTGKPDAQKPDYVRPKLTIYGAMTSLTAGGSGSVSEYTAMNMSKKKRS